MITLRTRDSQLGHPHVGMSEHLSGISPSRYGIVESTASIAAEGGDELARMLLRLRTTRRPELAEQAGAACVFAVVQRLDRGKYRIAPLPNLFLTTRRQSTCTVRSGRLPA